MSAIFTAAPLGPFNIFLTRVSLYRAACTVLMITPQGPHFTEAELSAIGLELDHKERQLMAEGGAARFSSCKAANESSFRYAYLFTGSGTFQGTDAIAQLATQVLLFATFCIRWS